MYVNRDRQCRHTSIVRKRPQAEESNLGKWLFLADRNPYHMFMRDASSVCHGACGLSYPEPRLSLRTEVSGAAILEENGVTLGHSSVHHVKTYKDL